MNMRTVSRFPATVRLTGLIILTLTFTGRSAVGAATNTVNQPGWLTQPLSLAEALNTALQRNRTILKSQHDLEAARGISLQTRAIAVPKVLASGSYSATDPKATEQFFPGQTLVDQNWDASIQVVQSIYEGGKLVSALRAAKLTKEQAFLQHQTSIADTLLATRVAYYDVLVAAQDIVVREASVNLLAKELDEQQRRYDAGTVPRFNVLRAEVAVANSRPALIRARNNHRIAKNNLVQLLGYDLPREVWENIPLQLTDTLDVAPFTIKLPDAIQQALERRTELGALRKAEQLRQEDITSARSGRLPSVQAFAGWGWRNSSLSTDLRDDVDGWKVGVQMDWYIFDGFATRGKVTQAKAAHEKSLVELDDTGSKIELEVRTAYSVFIGASEVLESQKKVQEQADEALRLAKSRADAGSGTQLDVLSAETALTEARTTQIQAQYEYAVAVAKLERAIGAMDNAKPR
jgi:outer membrane protein TolC